MTLTHQKLSAEAIEEAGRLIAPHILRTPLLTADILDETAGGRVYAKAECLQRTGSFKLRGALTHLLSLSEEKRARGVVAYSSGNHAQGVARAAKIAGMPAAIVMPSDAPRPKRDRTARDGAEIVLHDRERESREEIAQKLAEERGGVLVPPFDHELTMIGQGTAGAELAAEIPEAPDQVLICCSGGGLAAGVGLAVRAQHPEAEIITVEPEGFDDMARSLASDKAERNARRSGSICDALLVETPGKLTLPVLRQLGARGVTVSDEETLRAMAFAFRELRVVLEPGGAVALAAVLCGKVETAGRVTALILSGGNTDQDILMGALKRY